MHVYFINEGLPESLNRFEQLFERHSFGGQPTRLRQMRFYNLQLDKRYLNHYLNELRPREDFKEMIYRDGVNYKFKHRNSPFKIQRANKMLNLGAKVFGRFVGVKPIDWDNVPMGKKTIPTQCVNTFTFGMSEDNAVLNERSGIWEEWL